jgi:hypothetical protein
VAGVGGDVDRGGRLFEAREEIGERQGRLAVLSDHDGRDPLVDGGERVAMLEDSAVGVAVGVDETRREDEASRVDDLLPRPRLQRADLRDAAVGEAHRGAPPGRPGAVDDERVEDERAGGRAGRRGGSPGTLVPGRPGQESPASERDDGGAHQNGTPEKRPRRVAAADLRCVDLHLPSLRPEREDLTSHGAGNG